MWLHQTGVPCGFGELRFLKNLAGYRWGELHVVRYGFLQRSAQFDQQDQADLIRSPARLLSQEFFYTQVSDLLRPRGGALHDVPRMALEIIRPDD